MRSWHDYHITGYAVDGEARQMELRLLWPYKTEASPRKATLVFSGIEGYFLEHDLFGNIVMAIEATPLDQLISENAALFEAESKWGWPLFWRKNTGATLSFLNEKQAQAWSISTSYGLCGWVIAKGISQYA